MNYGDGFKHNVYTNSLPRPEISVPVCSKTTTATTVSVNGNEGSTNPESPTLTIPPRSDTDTTPVNMFTNSNSKPAGSDTAMPGSATRAGSSDSTNATSIKIEPITETDMELEVTGVDSSKVTATMQCCNLVIVMLKLMTLVLCILLI